jgi:hypothetical protein
MQRMKIARLAASTLALTGLLVTAGCGDDGDHHAGCGLEANCQGLPDYAAGMTAQGKAGLLGVRLIESDPAPPDVGASFTVEVIDTGGTAVTGGTVTTVNAWSIDCGHYGLTGGDGVTVTDNGDGTFTFVPDYAHGGPWNVEIAVTDGADSDDVELGFCLPETDGGHTHE